jgi:hypothetical protein
MTAITKKALRALVLSARKHGYYHDTETGKLWANCPVCKERIECQDYVWKPNGAGRHTWIGTLDAGMSDHIENYCSECPECYALRGTHEEGCKNA